MWLEYPASGEDQLVPPPRASPSPYPWTPCPGPPRPGPHPWICTCNP